MIATAFRILRPLFIPQVYPANYCQATLVKVLLVPIELVMDRELQLQLQLQLQ